MFSYLFENIALRVSVLGASSQMHIAPQDRSASLSRVKALLRPGGSVFATIRLGPINEERGTFHISAPEFVADAEAAGFKVVPRGDYSDLFGRPEVSWKSYELTR